MNVVCNKNWRFSYTKLSQLCVNYFQQHFLYQKSKKLLVNFNVAKILLNLVHNADILQKKRVFSYIFTHKCFCSMLPPTYCTYFSCKIFVVFLQQSFTAVRKLLINIIKTTLYILKLSNTLSTVIFLSITCN